MNNVVARQRNSTEQQLKLQKILAAHIPFVSLQNAMPLIHTSQLMNSSAGGFDHFSSVLIPPADLQPFRYRKILIALTVVSALKCISVSDGVLESDWVQNIFELLSPSSQESSLHCWEKSIMVSDGSSAGLPACTLWGQISELWSQITLVGPKIFVWPFLARFWPFCRIDWLLAKIRFEQTGSCLINHIFSLFWLLSIHCRFSPNSYIL